MSIKLKRVLLAIVFILGYTSLSFELIILRELINFVGSNTLVTSIVIAQILLFMSVGYYVGSVIRVIHRSIRKYIEKSIAFLCVWYIAVCTYTLQEVYFVLFKLVGITDVILLVFIFSLFFLALPSSLLGFVTSVIGRFIHHQNSNYTGRFMAVDTVGSVLGSLLTTLVFMPLMGVGATVVILVAMTILALLLIRRAKNKLETVVFSVMILSIAMVVNNEKLLFDDSALIKNDNISRIEIFETDVDENGTPHSKILAVNSSMSSKISDDKNEMFDYVKFINETFIEKLDKDRVYDILVLGAGGFTIGIDDEVNNYIFLDIDKDLKDISENYFLDRKLTDNKQFIVQDAYLYMLNNTHKFDIIVIDVYSAVKSIPMNFVTVDFFAKIKDSLKENGIMIANIITSANFETQYAKRIDNTLRYVFGQYLTRQVIGKYDGLHKQSANVEYIYYNYKKDDVIYSINRNTAIY